MGFRASVITRHREYGAQTFCDWENFTDNVVPKMVEAGLEINDSEAQDFYEVEKSKLQEFVNSLPNNDKQSFSEEHTNKQLKEDLQLAINESPEAWVSWEWF